MTSVLCGACKGEGVIPCEECSSQKKDSVNEGQIKAGASVCKTCEGTGTIKCPYCLGFGLVDFPAIA
jgi:hypothetical protein